MNELKPEDVMKALECCFKNNCAGCPQDEIGTYSECISLTMSHALALLREKDKRIGELELTLHGVMHFVDKWLDGAELEKDEVNRSATMREKILQVVEEMDVDYKLLEELYQEKCEQVLKANEIFAEKNAEIDRLTAYNANLICANTDITNRHKDYVEEAERIARADAITEFSERMEKSITAQVNVSSNEMLAAFMWCLDLVKNVEKQLKGEPDEL